MHSAYLHRGPWRECKTQMGLQTHLQAVSSLNIHASLHALLRPLPLRTASNGSESGTSKGKLDCAFTKIVSSASGRRATPALCSSSRTVWQKQELHAPYVAAQAAPRCQPPKRASCKCGRWQHGLLVPTTTDKCGRNCIISIPNLRQPSALVC